MKKFIVLMAVSIICIITFVCFNNNKDKSKIAPNKMKGSTKEYKIVSSNKKYYSCNIPYISHDDYYDYAKQEVKVANYVNDGNSDDSSLIFIETSVSEDTIVDINVDTNENVKLEDENNETEETSKQNIEVSIEEEKVLEEEIDIVEIEQEKESSYEEVNLKQEEKNIELAEDVIVENVEESIKVETKKGYYSPSGKYLGDSKVKVIDVSYYQGDINWEQFASDGDFYGVILRLGYYDTLDKKFEQNISEIKRLNIPYGIYLFSYATTMNGSNKEANFTNEMIDKYDLKPTLGIYYDIESWNAKNGSTSDTITKDMYDSIISNYINKVNSHINDNYKVKVYSGRWYAMNRLGDVAKSYVDWVAEYNNTCKYDGSYSMWQYTSKGNVPGITGNVDISYLY